MTEHGNASTYVNHGCRCQWCTAANTERGREQRRVRFASRRIVDGVLVAPVPQHRHGIANTYTNWGCRCAPCAGAHRRASRDRYWRRVAVTR
ncbi:hypothetical protein SAMN05421837_107333 [Amycolatopsis pretoriensis]|uniref:Uncharacterized protein n=1 Tax=Amycolatopsis pretoriensis TaxID=218821 RepID=A0A1H5R9T5_9PSEU|nr:hypothetical protein [Amycolatopsis pretoriensis]SEF34351.1 hypothetical protein SAMN05421837_107333 [Amycolatopsis pretoriensis]